MSSTSTEREENFFDALETDDSLSTSPPWLTTPANMSISASEDGTRGIMAWKDEEERIEMGRVDMRSGAGESLHVTPFAPGPAAAREPSQRRRISPSPVNNQTTNPDFHVHHQPYHLHEKQTTPASILQQEPRLTLASAPSPRPSAVVTSLSPLTWTPPQHSPRDPISRPASSLPFAPSQSSSSEVTCSALREVHQSRATLRSSLSTRHLAANGINTSSKQGRPTRPRISLLHPPSTDPHRLSHLPNFAELQSRAPQHGLHGSVSVADLSEMARRRKDSRDGDLFLELADDQSNDAALSPRTQRNSHRTSYADKRRSLQLDLSAPSFHTRRSSTSSNPFTNRPSSRQNHNPNHVNSNLASEWSNYGDQSDHQEDGMSVSGRRSRQYTMFPERSPASPSRLRERIPAPDAPSYGRRRLSFGVPAQPRRNSVAKAQETHDDSTAESSDPKQADSTDVESQTAETVWDELDDLKSRIKKLELTGKMPPNSSATVSGESVERPRTATTAPTTVDSSPKRDPGPDVETPQPMSAYHDATIGTPSVANVHPMLHSALAKAKPLLNPSLYRILEATSKDALHLVAMTGSSSHPDGPFSSSSTSIVNGNPVSDRQVRRKADTLCRNLTDLCIALSDGKHEPMTAVPSPMLSNSRANSPSLRHARHSLGPGIRGINRPGSRLDERRSSILGIESLSGSSVRDANFDIPSDPESTPSHSAQPDRRRFSRDSSLLRAQMYRPDDFAAVASDEDPTLRSHSRAFTDLGGFRTPKSGALAPQRTSSLRETLEARRANEAAFDGNIELLGSDSHRRRRAFEHAITPPVVVEEDVDRADYHDAASSHVAARRRVTSFSQYQARRSNSDLQTHTRSLSQQRRQAFVD